jgi:hypothetical protein
MRGLSIAALLAMVTLSGCVLPQPIPPVAAPSSETPAATSNLPPTADVPTAPPAESNSTVVPDTTVQDPTATAAAAPKENAPAAQSSQAPPARSPQQASAPRPEELKAPARPPVVVATPVEPPTSPSPRAATPPQAASPPAAVPAQPPAAPALDLAGLAQRLRDTNAIGMFTKLSLKNQVDDLLEQFRGFYRGEITVPMAELRQRYETLLLKVLTLVQDADQQLARAITSSREVIWGILADPQKFAQI